MSAATAAAAPAAAGDATAPDHKIHLTVLSGFMGAGKTTIILNTIKQLKRDNPAYKIAWLKNEYGVNEVDTLLAQELNSGSSNGSISDGSNGKSSSITGVKEILNGCICCTLVGRLGDALLEICTEFQPDRVMIETSGSALPMTLSMELRRLADEHSYLALDAIVCVIDAVNFTSYEDTSVTAKMQAKYNDLILLNKADLCDDEHHVDRALDAIYELNDQTPVVRVGKDGVVDYNLLFGVDGKLMKQQLDGTHQHQHSHDCTAPDCSAHDLQHQHMQKEVEVINWTSPADVTYSQPQLIKWLKTLEADTYYRVKGLIHLSNTGDSTDAQREWQVLNYAFGRYEFIPLTSIDSSSKPRSTAVTIMLRPHTNVKFAIKQLRSALNIVDSNDIQIDAVR